MKCEKNGSSQVFSLHFLQEAMGLAVSSLKRWPRWFVFFVAGSKQVVGWQVMETI
jgi:hypothetical protein